MAKTAAALVAWHIYISLLGGVDQTKDKKKTFVAWG